MEIKENIWVVTVTEHDRFSGPKVIDTKRFDTPWEAEEFAKEQEYPKSSDRTGATPDYYVNADVRKV